MNRLTNKSRRQLLVGGLVLAPIGVLLVLPRSIVAQPQEKTTSPEANTPTSTTTPLDARPQEIPESELPPIPLPPPHQSLAPVVSSKSQVDQTPAKATLPPVPRKALSTSRTTMATGTITGAGTAGNIAKFTAPNAIGNSVLTEKSGKVGIGTTSPPGTFSVVGTASTPYSIYASNSGAGGSGVYGLHTSNSGDTAGITGETNSTSASAAGVRGTAKAASGGATSSGVRGLNLSTSANGYGVYGSHSGSGYGVYGTSPKGYGVGGYSESGTGLYGSTSNGIAIYGVGGGGDAIIGTSSGGKGVVGNSTGNAGVVGSSTNSVGVAAGSTNSYGLQATSTNSYGLYARTSNASSYAAVFQGNVYINGNLGKSSGSFKIDHPLHPATEYLSHSFVESPDMMNVYNGNATTNAKGKAWVTLPTYFQALNRDFRYQLTPIGQFAQAIVGQKIASNRFLIRTDKPNVEVSWQVTGIRNDAYARQHRIQVEENKLGDDRGKYLYPAGFGMGDDKRIGPSAPRLAAR